MRTHVAALVLAIAACATPSSLAGDGGDAFTYQGQLRQNGAAAAGPLDLVFRIYDAETAGLQVGSSVVVANFVDFDESGRFTVEIPFASATFNGAARWLEIEVDGVVLTPRQRINPVPYATRSLEVAAVNNAALNGTYSNALNLSNPSNTVSGTFTGSGANLSSLNANSIASGTLGGGRLSGVYGNALTMTNATNQFGGNGASLTNLNASNIASGTLGGSLLAGIYANAVTMTNPSNQFGGNGAGLTSLNASNLVTGFVGGTLLNGSYGNALTMTNASNQFGGNGAGLTNLNAGSIASGTLLSGRLAGTYGNALTMTNPSNQFGGNGAALTNLNAGNITSGTLGTAQLPSAGSWPLSGALNLDSTTFVVDAPSNRVGIGTASPQVALSVVGGVNVDEANTNDGGLPSSLRFGSFSGEAISSNRVGGANHIGLDLWTGAARRLSITNDGKIGIGTTSPSARLHMPPTGSGQAVEFPGLRIYETASSPNVLAGSANNVLVGNRLGVTISGGGEAVTGGGNSVASNFATVGGGFGNAIGVNSTAAFVGGGWSNQISDGSDGTIAGGFENTVLGSSGAIGGGEQNTVMWAGVVAGGITNSADDLGFVGGGIENVAGYSCAVVGGGGNVAAGMASAIGGGEFNGTSGDFSTVPGGRDNDALGAYSFAAGRRAAANHNGAFVWSDSTAPATPFASTGANQFLILANGGMGINTNAPTSTLQANGGIRARGGTPGGAGVNNNGFAFAGNGGDNGGRRASLNNKASTPTGGDNDSGCSPRPTGGSNANGSHPAATSASARRIPARSLRSTARRRSPEAVRGRSPRMRG